MKPNALYADLRKREKKTLAFKTLLTHWNECSHLMALYLVRETSTLILKETEVAAHLAPFPIGA